ncbi:hypothetical protein [Streptosporangium carneum]|uniref:hypothetical protein n=1 Tax=Streptosporangium carneum TaxID=47481 RepID=UPI0022F3115D|nr:hypothetical protein [Streptosporangium carneum]
MECPNWCDRSHAHDELVTVHGATVWKGLQITITASQIERRHSPDGPDGPLICLTMAHSNARPAVELSPGAARTLATIIEKSDGRGGTEYLVAELRHAADLVAPHRGGGETSPASPTRRPGP